MPNYLLTARPPPLSLIGGDFNCCHELFEPGTATANGGAELAQWAAQHDLTYIGEPGVPTHQAGHVLDLTFTNIPHATTEVRDALHSGSNHFTQVTDIPDRGQTPPRTQTFQVPD
jgi:hypothetical protein